MRNPSLHSIDRPCKSLASPGALQVAATLLEPHVTNATARTHARYYLPCRGRSTRHYATLLLSQVLQSIRRLSTCLQSLQRLVESSAHSAPGPVVLARSRSATNRSFDFGGRPSLEVGEAPELIVKALLESYSQRWGTLLFGICLESSDERNTRFVERLLRCAYPLLRAINGRTNTFRSLATMLRLRPDCLTSL
jgi:hypothetical protein